MRWLDRQKLQTEIMAGTFLNLGSSTAVEIAADLGFDWLLLDLEHGSGTLSDLRSMLLACRGSSAAPIVRIPSVDPDTVKFVMDSGAAGIMFPYVSTADEARRAVECMKYPPMGSRGVAGAIRATSFGRNWPSYFKEANQQSLVVVQIETPAAVDAADQIAAIEGVDVLFVGPLDLSVNLGHPGDFQPTGFQAALQQVVQACEKHGKTAGILSKPGFVEQHKEMGFRLFALGSDSVSVADGLYQHLQDIGRRPSEI
ncbi:MAG: aldolase/citrate lyase family protein [Planctomycetaceae bacterium]